MKDATFYKLLAAIVILGTLVTVILLAVTKQQYDNCSILSYIANGR